MSKDQRGTGGQRQIHAQAGVGGIAGAAGNAGAAGVAGFVGAAQAGVAGQAGAASIPSAKYRWTNVKLGGGGFVSAVIASTLQRNLFYARTDVGGLYRWDGSSSTWIPLLDWVSESQAGYLGVEAVALDPQAPERVYALAGIDYVEAGSTAVLRSNDYGDTFSITNVTAQWKAHGNGLGRQNGERLAVDPNLSGKLLCGTRRSGLWTSSDAGVSWTRVASLDITSTPNDNGLAFVLFDPPSGIKGQPTPRFFVGVSRLNETNLWVTDDAGASFQGVAGAPTDLMPGRAALAADGTLYVTYGNGAGPNGSTALSQPMDAGAIIAYDLRLGTANNVTPVNLGRAFSGISVDANNPKRLLATTINTYMAQPWGNGDRIFLSEDGGSNWSDLIQEQRIAMDPNGFPWIVGRAIHWAGASVFDPFDSEHAFVTSGNGVFSTSNLGAAVSTWKFDVNGLEETVPLDAISIPSGSLVSVVGDYDGAVHPDITISPLAGTHKPSTGTTTGVAYAGSAPNVVARVGGRLYRSTNGGVDWAEVPRSGMGNRGSVGLSADGAVLVWTPNNATTSYRTTDLGVTWTPIVGINFVTMIVGDPVNPTKLYAYNASAGTFFASTDGAVSFSQVATIGLSGSLKIRTVPGIEGEIWVAHNNGGLSRSIDSGTTFARMPHVPRCAAVGFGKAAPDAVRPTLFIWGRVGSGEAGVYRSTDIGTTWAKLSDERHQYGGLGNGQFILGDMNVFGRVYMSTPGRGLVSGDEMVD